MSKTLDPNQALGLVWPDLDPNCLQGLLVGGIFITCRVK